MWLLRQVIYHSWGCFTVRQHLQPSPLVIPLKMVSRPANNLARKRLIIDTDAGLDDAQAILMALAAKNAKVEAITTVYGNASTQQVCRNVLRLLKAANHLDVPIFQGCQSSLLGLSTMQDQSFHGVDGFGDVPDPAPLDFALINNLHAVTALVDLVKSSPGELTLIAIGPLTNIAMAIRLDPDFGKNLKECFVMGGNYRGVGNATKCAEFNFYTDPEAAHIVLSALQCPITVTPWELCLDCVLPWACHREIALIGTELNKLLNNLEAKQFTEYYTPSRSKPGYELADQFAVAAALDPGLIQQSEEVAVTVELVGVHTRGQMVIDHSKTTKANVTVVKRMDMDGIKELLVAARKGN